MAIIGIDEVGLGPWAGPLVVGAVILPEKPQDWFADLRDSKKISPKKRARLAKNLRQISSYGLGWVWPSEIDEIGYKAALNQATKRALHDLKSNFPTAHFSEIIIDGNKNYLKNTPLATHTSTLIKGDNLVKSISAASIIAKVARDNYMIEQSVNYPKYGFENHKGYGTAQHRNAIKKYGVTPIHRLSLRPIQKIFNLPEPKKSSKQPTAESILHGQTAEAKVANFLSSENHEILFRNYKTRICEIDLISKKDQNCYFTEVKYRQTSTHGDGLAAITPQKKRQMSFAAQVFLQNHPEFRTLQPLLAAASVSGPNYQIDDFLILTE